MDEVQETEDYAVGVSPPQDALECTQESSTMKESGTSHVSEEKESSTFSVSESDIHSDTVSGINDDENIITDDSNCVENPSKENECIPNCETGLSEKISTDEQSTSVSSEIASTHVDVAPEKQPCDLLLDDIISQLYVLFMSGTGLDIEMKWPFPKFCSPKYHSRIIASEWFSRVTSLSKQDLDIEIPLAIKYCCHLVSDNPRSLEVCCEFLNILQSDVTSFFMSRQKAQKQGNLICSDIGLALQSSVFNMACSLLNSVPVSQDVSQLKEFTRKFTQAVYGTLVDISKSDAKIIESVKIGFVFASLSRHDLGFSLELFQKQMKKVYFHGSAVEFIPFMKICSEYLSFSLKSQLSSTSSKSFLDGIIRLLKTTTCVELIEISLDCSRRMMNEFSIEVQYDTTRSSFMVLKKDFDESCETLFSICRGYCAKRKMTTANLCCMEAILNFESKFQIMSPHFVSQHDRLCSEILKLVETDEMRIYGLDHLGRYIKTFPFKSSQDDAELTNKRFLKLPSFMFPVGAIPRAQEAAMITIVLTEIGIRNYLQNCFKQLIKRGVEFEKASTAQRSIGLNAIANISSQLSIESYDKSMDIFSREYSPLATQYSKREYPSILVGPALRCFPYLGKSDASLLENCVDAAFGFDMTLVDPGRDALIRFASLGKLFTNKVIQLVVQSPYLRLISGSQHSFKHVTERFHLTSNIDTLDLIFDSMTKHDEVSNESAIELSSIIMIASTFPDSVVTSHAKKILDKIFSVSTSDDMSRMVQVRSAEKLMLGLCGQSSASDTCGGSQIAHFVKSLPVKDEQRIGDMISWWQSQCSMICGTNVPVSNNKETFLKALLQEYTRLNDERIESAILAALELLDDTYRVVALQLDMMIVQDSQKEVYNPKFVKLIGSLRISGTVIESHAISLIGSWLQAPSEELKAAVADWDTNVLRAVGKLLVWYVSNTSSVDCDLLVFFCRELSRGRERAASLKCIACAFSTILEAGKLHYSEAHAFTLKALSAFTGFKEIQVSGLTALLTNNVDIVLDHYIEAILRSFDAAQWENIPTTPPSERHKEFIANLIQSVLLLMDGSLRFEDSLQTKLVCVIYALYIHPFDSVRAVISRFSRHSSFLGSPGTRYGLSYHTDKVTSDERGLFLASFLKEEGLTKLPLPLVVSTVLDIVGYLNEYQAVFCTNMLVPWLPELDSENSDSIADVVQGLLKVSQKMPGGRCKLWREFKLSNSFELVVDIFVEAMVVSNPSSIEFVSASRALSEMAIGSAHKSSISYDIINALARHLPPASFTVPPMDDLYSFVYSDKKEKLVTNERIRVILHLLINIPFLLKCYTIPALIRVLFFLAIQVGHESEASCLAMKSLMDEMMIDPTSLDSPLSQYAHLPREIYLEFAADLCLCILYSPNICHTQRSLTVLQVFPGGLFELNILVSFVTRIGVVVGQECNRLSKIRKLKRSDLSKLEHTVGLLKVLTMGEIDISDCVIEISNIAKCLLSIPIADYDDIFVTIYGSALFILSQLSIPVEIDEHLSHDLMYGLTQAKLCESASDLFVSSGKQSFGIVLMLSVLMLAAKDRETILLISALKERVVKLPPSSVKEFIILVCSNGASDEFVGALFSALAESYPEVSSSHLMLFLVKVVKAGEPVWQSASFTLIHGLLLFGKEKGFQQSVLSEIVSCTQSASRTNTTSVDLLFSIVDLLPLDQARELSFVRSINQEDPDLRLVRHGLSNCYTSLLSSFSNNVF